MYILRYYYILLRHGFKCSGQALLQSRPMEVGQGNADMHMLNHFFSFGKSLLIVGIEMIGIRSLTYTPGLRVFGGRIQSDHFQRLSIGAAIGSVRG